jgi:hypothetical protein
MRFAIGRVYAVSTERIAAEANRETRGDPQSPCSTSSSSRRTQNKKERSNTMSKDKRLTQSPQQIRGSSQDHEKFTKGSIPRSFARDTGKAPAGENEGADKLIGQSEKDREGGYPPGI